MTVLNELKPGLDEKLYENALVLELRAQGHRVEQQKQFPVFYRGVEIGRGVPDLIIDEAVIADPKVAEAFNLGLEHFTGAATVPAAWLTLVKTNDVVGLKVFSPPGELCGTRPAVIRAITGACSPPACRVRRS